MTYAHPLTDTEVNCLAEFTIGAICGTDGIPANELPDTIPYPAVQATIEGRVINWEGMTDSEYDLLMDRIQGAAEAKIGETED